MQGYFDSLPTSFHKRDLNAPGWSWLEDWYFNSVNELNSAWLGSQYMRGKCWLKGKVALFRRLVTWGEGRFYPKTNSKYFDGSWKFSKDEKEINYSVRGSKTSLSSTVSRLSSGWLIVRHCFRNLVLKQSCHPPHGWGTLVPAEEFKDIVMYIP